MLANASTVARQPKMRVRVSSVPFELVAILKAGLVCAGNELADCRSSFVN